MPRYDFICTQCKTEKTATRQIKNRHLPPTCESCGTKKNMRRIYTPVGFRIDNK